MANREQRGNKEKKKPKKEKPKETQAASPFSKQSTAGAAKPTGEKG
ncbi:MAG: hypothetical protein JOZ84_00220 [Methylobacteriaceae bacterium]|nr:hypothetical protein [Methylobacteriaceae bacterium]